MLVKEKIKPEELLILNIYARNARALSFIKETLLKLKAHIAPNSIIVGDFNTSLSSIDSSGKQKLNRDIMKLIEALDQVDLIDIFRTFHPKSNEYTFFSAPHGTFSKIDNIIGHKADLNRCKIEIIPHLLSYHYGIVLLQ